jgi:AraC-like DNA-binding protein
VLSWRVLLDEPGLRVTEVSCPGDHRGWSAPEAVDGLGVVLVRRGVFRRQVDGVESVVDPGSAYLQNPGTEQRIAHPAGADLCTAITLSAAEHDIPARAGPVPVSVRQGLAHRLLVARATAGVDAVTLTDLATDLVAATLDAFADPDGDAAGHDADGVGHDGDAAGRARTSVGRRRQRRLVDDAREVLAADPTRPLPELAGWLAVSPCHLSRVFHRVTGVTLGRYRTGLRACAALERLAAGESGLAGLAADLGFADQAHLTRTLRAETGLPPGRLRALLGQGRPGTGE